MPNPDWFTVWHANPKKDDDAKDGEPKNPDNHNPVAWADCLDEISQRLCQGLNKKPKETTRIQCLVQADMLLCKLREENQQVGFPQIAKQTELITTCFEQLHDRIRSLLHVSTVHMDLVTFSAVQCHVVLTKHYLTLLFVSKTTTQVMLEERFRSFAARMEEDQGKLDIRLYAFEVLNSEFEDDESKANIIAQYNQAVLAQLAELISAMRYPLSHNPSQPILDALQRLRDLLVNRKRVTTRKLMSQSLHVIEQVTLCWTKNDAHKFEVRCCTFVQTYTHQVRHTYIHCSIYMTCGWLAGLGWAG